MYKEQFSFLINANWTGPESLIVIQFSLAQRRLKIKIYGKLLNRHLNFAPNPLFLCNFRPGCNSQSTFFLHISE